MKTLKIGDKISMVICQGLGRPLVIKGPIDLITKTEFTKVTLYHIGRYTTQNPESYNYTTGIC